MSWLLAVSCQGDICYMTVRGVHVVCVCVGGGGGLVV